MDFHLPADGSVLVVDDKVEEALPLIQLLSSQGIPCTYYDGRDKFLPDTPCQKVRLAFFDVQLFGPSDSHNYAANIRRLIDRLVPENNGPYILVLWSSNLENNAEEIKGQLTAPSHNKRPLTVIQLAKGTYFESSTDNTLLESILNSVDEELAVRFDDDDRHEIKNFVGDHIQPENTYIIKPNAISEIASGLDNNLQKENDIFQLFTMWEGFISKAAGETVDSFASLYDFNEFWTANLKYIIFLLGKAQLGEHANNISQKEILTNAVRTLNTSFLDIADNHCLALAGFSKSIQFDLNNIVYSDYMDGHLYKLVWNVRTDRYKLSAPISDLEFTQNPVAFKNLKNSVVKKNDYPHKESAYEFIDTFDDIKPSINTRLMIDRNVSEYVQPGNVYEIKVQWARKKKHLETYYKPKGNKIRDSETGRILLTNDEIKKFKFIELEVSPVCDYAQDKWVKYRFLPGVMIPSAHAIGLTDSINIYNEMPEIELDGEKYQIIFDFKLFKSLKKESHSNERPIFRLKNELSFSILSRLSSHASRIGIISI